MDEFTKLVALAKRTQERGVFDLVIERIETRLFSYIRRHFKEETAKDLLQECLLRMWKNLGSLREVERFEAWAFQIARNLIRRKHRDIERSPIAGAPLESIMAIAPEALTDLAKLVREALSQAGKDCFELLSLHYVDEKSWDEIGEELGLSEDRVQKRGQRCRDKAREFLEKQK